MKISWVQGIFLVMTGFAVMMATFLFRAYHAQEDLVAENYYEQEIRYQQQIDKLGNVQRMGGTPAMDLIGDELVVSFPDVFKGETIKGELYLQRPSDARADDRIAFDLKDGEPLHVPIADRMKGLYKVHLEWSAGEENFLVNDRIYLK